MKTKQQEKEKEKRSEEKKVLLRIKLGTFVRNAGPHRYNWATWNPVKKIFENILLKPFPLALPHARQCIQLIEPY